MKLKKIYHF